MSVNAAPCAAQIKGVPEERCTRRFLETERWSSEEDAIAIWGGKGQHENVRGLNAFLLHTRGGDVDLISARSKTRWLVTAEWNTSGSWKGETTHPARMLMPPPVPVTQPR
jgi:hypothetical protein